MKKNVRVSITAICLVCFGVACASKDSTDGSNDPLGSASSEGPGAATGTASPGNPTSGPTSAMQPTSTPTEPTGTPPTGSQPTAAPAEPTGAPPTATPGEPTAVQPTSTAPSTNPTGPEPGPEGTGGVGPETPEGAGGAGPIPPVDPLDPEPTLVTSGQDAYWQEGEVTQVNGGNAESRVDLGQVHQNWLGFGGTFNEAGWDALSVLEASERERAIRLLFHARQGANFAWGRIPMGASDYAMDRYSLNDNANDFAMERFSIDRDRELMIPYIEAALAVKPDVRLWASPWSPPAWMKTTGDMNGGRLTNSPEVLEAYALYFARFVEEYAKEGLEIEHVQPQNEPGYETRYPSCLWTAELLRDFVRDYLGPTLAARDLSTEIWLGTVSAPEDTQHLDAMMADSNAARFIKGFGLQWNTMDSAPTLASRYRLPVMQTEHKCGNYPWVTASFNPDRPPNDHAYAEESWGLIRDWLRQGVSIYSAWNMVLDTEGKNLDYQRPWPQNALLTVDRQARTLRETPAYYVFRHVSQFVDPGAVRVGTTGSLDALAFKNPDDSVVVVVHNSGGQARPTTLDVNGATLQFSVPARGWATVNWPQ